MTSYNPNDIFFKWCDNCKKGYGDIKVNNEDRAELGHIHNHFPEWDTEQVIRYVFFGETP